VVLQALPDSTTLRQSSRCRELHNCGYMHVHLSDPSLVDDLLAFLRTRQCVAVVDPSGRIDVSIPDSTREDAARLELGLYLQVWLGSHPDVDVVLLK
jgi:predicted SAM-dependent methyltransferase